MQPRCSSPIFQRDAIFDLKRALSNSKQKSSRALEELIELREENAILKQQNASYVERLRGGIKRATIFVRDKRYKQLHELSFNEEGINCFIEIGPQIAKGEYKYTHEYTVLTTQGLPTGFKFTSGVIKYYIEEKALVSDDKMVDYDCMKQWYLADMATNFSLSLGLNPSTNISPKFIPCAKVVLGDGRIGILEPKLDSFDRITNNMGDGVEEIDDMLSAYMHYVFVMSGRKHLPCDFQGDENYMLLTDPEINTWDDCPEFLGVENNGKNGVERCLGHHLEENCSNNKYCNALGIGETIKM